MGGKLLALLQEEWRIVVRYLVKICCACLVTGCDPAMWVQVKVVSIPKSGSNYFSGHRDFRPISLRLFLLNTLRTGDANLRFLRFCITTMKDK
jgi:hypothetical protein